MGEALRSIAAYQKTPFIIIVNTGSFIPEGFMTTLTYDEKYYLLEQSKSRLSEVFYSLLSDKRTAGATPAISRLLYDVFNKQPVVNSLIGTIYIPIAEQPGTQAYLKREFYDPFWEGVNSLYTKTYQQYGFTHIICIEVLPFFKDGKVSSGITIIKCDDALSDNRLMSTISHKKITSFSSYTWIGVSPQMLLTASMRMELLESVSDVIDSLNIVVS